MHAATLRARAVGAFGAWGLAGRMVSRLAAGTAALLLAFTTLALLLPACLGVKLLLPLAPDGHWNALAATDMSED